MLTNAKLGWSPPCTPVRFCHTEEGRRRLAAFPPDQAQLLADLEPILCRHTRAEYVPRGAPPLKANCGQYVLFCAEALDENGEPLWVVCMIDPDPGSILPVADFVHWLQCQHACAPYEPVRIEDLTRLERMSA